MNRLLAPSLNPAGLSAALAAIVGAGIMIWHVTQHQAVFSLPVAFAAGSAVLSLLTRRVVTPVDDPRSADGKPLVVQAPPPATPPAAAPAPPPPPAAPAALPSGSRQSPGKSAF